MEDLVGLTICCVVQDSGDVDGTDIGPVFCLADDVVRFLERGHVCEECRLEEGNSVAGSWSRNTGHKCV